MPTLPDLTGNRKVFVISLSPQGQIWPFRFISLFQMLLLLPLLGTNTQKE